MTPSFLNRRAFLHGSSLLIGSRLLPAQQGVHAPGVVTLPAQDTAIPRGKRRDLLQKQCPPDALRASLIPIGMFRPFPVAGDREWSQLRPQTRAALIRAGELALPRLYAPLPATLFLQYVRVGNRSEYEGIRSSNLAILQACLFAECAENKGRFLDHIADGLWSICEQSFWGVPAHLYIQHAHLGLPDPNDPIVDLFAGDTAALLATTIYLMGAKLDTVSPQLRPRVLLECERRIFNPLLSQNLMWMGLPGGQQRDDLPWDVTPAGKVQPVNNWDAWICWNWITTSLLLDTDATRRLRTIQKAMVCLDNFINTYPDDGGCEEGPSYYNRAAVCMSDGLEMLQLATNGRVNIWHDPLLRHMGEYLVEARIAGNQYINTGDAHSSAAHDRAASSFDRDAVFRYGKKVASPTMVALARADLAEDYIPATLPAVFDEPHLRAEPDCIAPLLKDVWLPESGLFAARMQADSANGLYLACIAADNGKSHSHNDTGSIWLYLDGEPVLIDLGRETYRKQSFDETRYQMFSTTSAFHNLPTIGDVQQGIGSAFRATGSRYSTDNRASGLSFDLAEAYPKAAGLRTFKRSIELDRVQHHASIIDTYQLSAVKPVVWSFISYRPVQQTSGALKLLPRADDRSGPVTLTFDASALQATVETLPMTDAALHEAWGSEVYRILLRPKTPVAQGEGTFLFTA